MRWLLSALLACSGSALADTLIIVHDGGEETMTGTFTTLVIGATFGELAFTVDDSSPAEWDGLSADGFDVDYWPWSIDLDVGGDVQHSDLFCSSLERYFDGYVTLTLRCAP